MSETLKKLNEFSEHAKIFLTHTVGVEMHDFVSNSANRFEVASEVLAVYSDPQFALPLRVLQQPKTFSQR